MKPPHFHQVDSEHLLGVFGNLSALDHPRSPRVLQLLSPVQRTHRRLLNGRLVSVTLPSPCGSFDRPQQIRVTCSLNEASMQNGQVARPSVYIKLVVVICLTNVSKANVYLFPNVQ